MATRAEAWVFCDTSSARNNNKGPNEDGPDSSNHLMILAVDGPVSRRFTAWLTVLCRVENIIRRSVRKRLRLLTYPSESLKSGRGLLPIHNAKAIV